MNEDEIDQIIDQIGRDWHDNGYFGDPREDSGLIYEVVDRVLAAHPDTKRIDWLSDVNNHIGNVHLPTECVTRNPDSLRAAIDAAMELDA